MVSSEVLVTVLAGIIGFVVIWYLMGLITDKFSTGPAPPSPPQSRSEWAEVLGVASDASSDEIKCRKSRSSSPVVSPRSGPKCASSPKSGCSRSTWPSMPPSGGLQDNSRELGAN
jgi:hypothetical protein